MTAASGAVRRDLFEIDLFWRIVCAQHAIDTSNQTETDCRGWILQNLLHDRMEARMGATTTPFSNGLTDHLQAIMPEELAAKVELLVVHCFGCTASFSQVLHVCPDGMGAGQLGVRRVSDWLPDRWCCRTRTGDGLPCGGNGILLQSLRIANVC